MLIISYHPRLVPSSDLSPTRATRPDHLNLVELIFLVIYGRRTNPEAPHYVVTFFPRSHVPFSLLGPQISHGISNTGMYTATSLFNDLIPT